MIHTDYCLNYMVTPKGWDCQDDAKLFKSDVSKVFCLKHNLFMANLMIQQREKQDNKSCWKSEI